MSEYSHLDDVGAANDVFIRVGQDLGGQAIRSPLDEASLCPTASTTSTSTGQPTATASLGASVGDCRPRWQCSPCCPAHARGHLDLLPTTTVVFLAGLSAVSVLAATTAGGRHLFNLVMLLALIDSLLLSLTASIIRGG